MKSTGIVRKVDELGRIVLPKELRQTLNINERDPIEIFVDNSSIILQKYEPACMFCNNTNDMVQYMGRNICKECLKAIEVLTRLEKEDKLRIISAMYDIESGEVIFDDINK